MSRIVSCIPCHLHAFGGVDEIDLVEIAGSCVYSAVGFKRERVVVSFEEKTSKLIE